MRRAMALLWQLEFTRNLSRQAGITLTVRDLRIEAVRLPAGGMPGTDGAKQFNLTLARSLLGTVALLEREQGFSTSEAVRIAGTAFGASGTWLARGAIRFWQRLERDSFASVVKRGPSVVARVMWGDGMTVEDRQRSNGVSLCATTCPFHEYFWNAGRSDLTPILCAWDTAWQAEVNASARPLRVEIRDTIARGGEVCKFVFRRPELEKAAR